MKTRLFLNIALRIIALFSTGFMMSFITPKMHEFFGDTPKLETCLECVDRQWNWGGPHYWFFWCMFFLFILSIINFGMWVACEIKKEYEL